ncbi:hypothetical protein V3C99_001669 [Haemonchus contortus]|uniref:Uncharacterized protein n=1 Tax=Haemonchus contortus TaxID=6289 RepID=A0A7I4YEA8_HAECO
METGSYQSQPQEPDVATQMNTLAVTEITNKMEKTKPQIENAQLRKKRLEKRREELYGPEGTRMDVDEKNEATETRNDPIFVEWANRYCAGKWR